MVQRIAIFEPNSRERATLERALLRGGYEPFSPDWSVEVLSRHLSMAVHFEMLAPLADVNLIIIENRFPRTDGVTLIRLLKENKYTVHIPIMVVSHDGYYESVLNCVQAGAADYVVKPFEEASLLRRVAMVMGQDGLAELGYGVESLVMNFQDYLIQELKRSERSNLAMSIILGRVDTPESLQQNQKILKNAKGEHIDTRLKFFDGFLSGARRHLRQFDTVLRYGPEGMIVVLPMTCRDGAFVVEERLAEIFQSERGVDDLIDLRRLELRTGVSSFPDEATSKHDLLTRAEKDLLGDRGQRRDRQKSSAEIARQVFMKNLFCPVCSATFKMEKVRDRAFRVIRRETDFRPVYEKGNPLLYAVPVCPKCHYAAFFSDFERLSDTEIVKLKRARASRGRLAARCDFRSGRTLENAIVSYRLAATCYEKRQTPPSTFARLYHRAAWLLREADAREEEQEMLHKALAHYERSFLREDLKGKKISDLEVAYLIGDLSLRLGEPKRAIDYLGNVIRSPKKKEKSRLVQMARDRWYEAKEALK